MGVTNRKQAPGQALLPTSLPNKGQTLASGAAGSLGLGGTGCASALSGPQLSQL